MTQTRLHFTAGRADAERLFAALEAAFEEDGCPLAIVEVDEARGIREISLYADDDVDDAERRMREILARPLSAPRRSSARSCPTSTGWRVRSKG